jgi:geranylgeranyl pyrophosphate synthase
MAALDLAEYLIRQRERIDRAIDTRLPGLDEEPRPVHEAMRHALFPGGKRLRPIFALAVCDLAEQPAEAVLDAACAVELVHTASLILDDLPCMDDAQSRRGMPCTHIRYGKATALLASMALLSRAFALTAANAAATRPGAVAEAVSLLADAVGTRGLVYGQHLDLSLTGITPTMDALVRVHELKAGALFLASVQIPACLLDLPERSRTALYAYARAVGLAFQIIDDLHDARSPHEDAGKTTFATHLGVPGAGDRAHALISEAVDALSAAGAGAEPLRMLAEHLRLRIGG